MDIGTRVTVVKGSRQTDLLRFVRRINRFRGGYVEYGIIFYVGWSRRQGQVRSRGIYYILGGRREERD